MDVALKQVHFAGITMQMPEIWNYETEEYNEEDGTKSYSMRSIDISIGVIPEGSDAYIEASRTYEDVVSEEEISSNDEPIVCFEFQKREAFGFNVWTDDGKPCFFFCTDIPSKGTNQLLTVLASARKNEELQELIDFVEENLSVE